MNVQEIHCPHCGNSDLHCIQLCIVLPSSIFRNLYRDEQGKIWAEERIDKVEDRIDPVSQSLHCSNCGTDIPNPGVMIQ